MPIISDADFENIAKIVKLYLNIDVLPSVKTALQTRTTVLCKGAFAKYVYNYAISRKPLKVIC